MGTTPLYWQEEFRTYIYSRSYTLHGALGRLCPLSFTAVNMVGEPVDPFLWLKKFPALPLTAFHHPPWDYGIVFTYGLTPPHWAEGVAFIAAFTLATGLLEEDSIVCFVCLAGSSGDELQLRLRLSLVLGRTCPCT
jgi:hypothetical protein